jgi:EAL domain-containing protein (putative c-di-GMP-specific phosphodiesterase class I)
LLTLNLLILAAQAQEAETLFNSLQRALLPVRGSFTQHPRKLNRTHQANLIIACVSEQLSAEILLEHYTQMEQDIPFLLVNHEDNISPALLKLCYAGARGLIASGDDVALVRAVRREYQILKLIYKNKELRSRLKQGEHKFKQLVERVNASASLDAERSPAHETYRSLFEKSATQTPPNHELLDLLAPEYRDAVQMLLTEPQQQMTTTTPAQPVTQPTVLHSTSQVPAKPVPQSPPPAPLTLEEQPHLELREPSEPGDGSLQANILQALQHNQCALAYQPMISLRGDSQEPFLISCFLRDSAVNEQDSITPLNYFDLPTEVLRWLIRQALIVLARCRQNQYKAHFVIELSSELIQDHELLIWICDQLRELNVRGHWISFQVAEASARDHTDAVTLLAQGLEQIKSHLALSQFGGSPDSELLLTQLPIHSIQLIPNLARYLGTDQLKQERVKQLIHSAHQVGIKTTLCGIEDELALATAWETGADYVYSHFLAAPLAEINWRVQA